MSTDKPDSPLANLTSPPTAALVTLSLIATAVFIALIPMQASAQQGPNQVFSGRVLVDGHPPPDGSALTAWIGQDRLGEVKIRRGRFRIVIPQRGDVSFAGKRVSFRVNGTKVEGTGIWKAGGATELVLIIGGLGSSDAPPDQNPTRSQTSQADGSQSRDHSFLGAEPLVCDRLNAGGALNGRILNETNSVSSEITATLVQAGCLLTGKFKVTSQTLDRSVTLLGTVDGNFVRFIVPAETNDDGKSLNFSGIIDSNKISGQYFSPHTREIGRWILLTPDAAPSVLEAWVRSSENAPQGVLADLRSQLEGSAAPNAPEQIGAEGRADTSGAVQTTQPASGVPEKEPSPSKTDAALTEERGNRGFFFNSLPGNSSAVDEAMEPTTLAVIGILLTLVATGVQLLRGN